MAFALKTGHFATVLGEELEADSDWLKTPHPNLIRCKPGGNYFGRVRVNGKSNRRSPAKHVLSVAKLKRSDFPPVHRGPAINMGQSAKGEVIIEVVKKEIEDDPARFLKFRG